MRSVRSVPAECWRAIALQGVQSAPDGLFEMRLCPVYQTTMLRSVTALEAKSRLADQFFLVEAVRSMLLDGPANLADALEF